MDADLEADALSALLYSYSNGVLTIADSALCAAIASRKIPLQSRYQVAISFKGASVVVRHGCERTCAALLRDVLSVRAVSPEAFVAGAGPESALPGAPAPRRCFRAPAAPRVPPAPPDALLPAPVTLASPPGQPRAPAPPAPFGIATDPPNFFREQANGLLRYYQPAKRGDHAPPPPRPAPPPRQIEAEAPPRLTAPGLVIAMKPVTRPPIREMKCANGRRTLLIRGREALAVGEPIALAELRAGVCRILGLAPTAPVTAFVFA
jgi:hypothetical protein